MTSLDLTQAVSAEHIRDLRRAAGRSRLSALARCCRPSTWARAARRTGAAGALLRATLARTPTGADVPCVTCA